MTWVKRATSRHVYDLWVGGRVVASVQSLGLGGWAAFAYPGADLGAEFDRNSKTGPGALESLQAWCERIVDGQTAEESAA